MKWAVWGLLLLNVLLLAYFNLNVSYPNGQQAPHPPIQPEKIRLLTPQEVETLPRKTADVAAQPAPPPVQFGCYEWGSFSKATLARARNILTKFSINAGVKQQTSQDAARYWVYIPPLGTLQAAQAKAEELRGQGINDVFVVLEPQWRHAISFGVFKDEQLATKLLEELKSKGVVSAVKGVRNQEKGQASLLMNNVSSDTAAEIDKLKPDFPGSELKQVTCQ